MKWLVRKILALFGTTRPSTPDRELARHNATLRRADHLLRVVTEYDKADASRREHR